MIPGMLGLEWQVRHVTQDASCLDKAGEERASRKAHQNQARFVSFNKARQAWANGYGDAGSDQE